jgi:hypothetical protein
MEGKSSWLDIETSVPIEKSRDGAPARVSRADIAGFLMLAHVIFHFSV